MFKNTDYLSEIRETEIQNLIKFKTSRDSHACIMDSLAFLRCGTDENPEFSIIMDLADIDLSHFLPYDRDTVEDKYSLRDLLLETAELAGALAWLHSRLQISGKNLACCHGDLKPSNVLLFDVGKKNLPVGRWKIADFGLSTIRTPKEDTREENGTRYAKGKKETIVTKAKRKPGPYTAPEFVNGEIGRNSDVWSYGCILVDIIASRMKKTASLRELRWTRGHEGKISLSTDWFHRNGALNSAVQAWLDALDTSTNLKHPTERAALPECKKLLEDILVIDPDRPKADDIRTRLIEIGREIPIHEGASVPVANESESEDEMPQSFDLSVFESTHRATQGSRPLALDQRADADSILLSKIQKWILAPELDVLWIDEPLGNGLRSVSPFCSGLYHAAQNAGFPVLTYLCYRERRDDGARKTKLEMLVDLTHSLIYQLQTHLEEVSAPLQSVHQERLDSLNGTATLTDEISVLADLWGAMKSHWFCIIDGFHILEYDADPILMEHLRELLRVLCPSFEDGTPSDPNKSKTLISTSGRSHLLAALPRQSKLATNNFSSSVKAPVYKDLEFATKRLKNSRDL